MLRMFEEISLAYFQVVCLSSTFIIYAHSITFDDNIESLNLSPIHSRGIFLSILPIYSSPNVNIIVELKENQTLFYVQTCNEIEQRNFNEIII